MVKSKKTQKLSDASVVSEKFMGNNYENDPKKMPSYQEQMSALDLTLEQMEDIFGDSGTKRWGGFYFQEYNELFANIQQRATTIEEMRRGDGYVKAALRAIKSPLLACKWDIQIKSEDTEDLEIKKFVEKNLFGMKRTWKEFLREALSYLDFGFYVFELLWKQKNGEIILEDLAPRIPSSILRFRTVDNKFGVQQILQTDEFEFSYGGTTNIPASKLLILTNDKEGDDVTGQSVLRAAYKHYILKDRLYKIQGIAAERFGVGIPVIKPGATAGVQDKAKLEEMGRNMRANEQAYIVLPNSDSEVTILTPQGRSSLGEEISGAIEHHGKQILMSILASFIALGTDGKGSYSLSQDQSSFFIKTLDDFASYFTEQINNQIIKKLVKVNFGEREIYPTLQYSPIGDLNTKEIADSINVLVTAGVLSPDAKLKTWVRDAFGMPQIPDDEVEAMKEQELENKLRDLEPIVVPIEGNDTEHTQ